MKMKNYLLPALATALVLTSCQNDGVQETTDTGAKKSVTVTIANIAAPAPATRATQSDFTPTSIPVADVADLTVYFLDGTTVVDSRALSSGDLVSTTPDHPTDVSREYTFHQIPETADDLVITNIAGATSAGLLTGTLGALELENYQGAYTAATNDAPAALPEIPVWGESGAWTGPTTVSGDDYPRYNAGEVTVAPQLARIEIGNIACLDLGSQFPDASGHYVRFGSLGLVNVGIHDTKVGTFGATGVTNYPNTPAGTTAWNTAGWNKDAITGTDKTLNGHKDVAANMETYNDEVFGFNVVPGAVPNIILEISGATENEIEGVEIPGTVNATDRFFVKSVGLTGVTGFEAGKIYQVDFEFNSKDVLPWDGQEDFICVDVTVVIPDWVIVDEVTPVFE
jgi:hypothetical protein